MIDPASGRRLTYVELLAQSERVAHGLLERFSPGEHVAACMPNLPEFLLLQFGAALAGMVLVPVPPALRGRDLAHVLRASHAAGVFFSPEFRGASLTELIAQLRAELPELREAVSLEGWSAFLATAPVDGELPEVDPGDPSQIQFTSGQYRRAERRRASPPRDPQLRPVCRRGSGAGARRRLACMPAARSRW